MKCFELTIVSKFDDIWWIARASCNSDSLLRLTARDCVMTLEDGECISIQTGFSKIFDFTTC